MNVPDEVLIATYAIAGIPADRIATEVLFQQLFVAQLPENYSNEDPLAIAQRLIRLQKSKKLPKLGRRSHAEKK